MFHAQIYEKGVISSVWMSLSMSRQLDPRGRPILLHGLFVVALIFKDVSHRMMDCRSRWMLNDGLLQSMNFLVHKPPIGSPEPSDTSSWLPRACLDFLRHFPSNDGLSPGP